MRPFFGPLHLLFLAESFAHHFVHRRLHKPGRDRLAVVISLPVIRNQVPVVHDIRAQLRQRLDQWREPGIRLVEPTFKGEWYASTNFAAWWVPGTMHGQSPPHRRP